MNAPREKVVEEWVKSSPSCRSEDCDARESLELLAERPWRCFVLAGNLRRQRNQSISR